MPCSRSHYPAYLGLTVLLALWGCDALEPDCDIRPSVSARDTTVAAFDTVRIRAESRDACGGAMRFLWSFDGGETYDTTAAGILVKVFGRSDLGLKRLRIRSMSGKGRVSPSMDIDIIVEERRFAYRPAWDTLRHFGNAEVAVDLSPSAPVPGIAWYCLSESPAAPCTDSSRAPVLRLPVPRSLFESRRLYATLRLESGARSDTASVVLVSGPKNLGAEIGSIMAASAGPASLRLVLSSRSDSGVLNPRSGSKVADARVLDMDSLGRILGDRATRSSRDLSFSSMHLGADGLGWAFGRDGLAPTHEDFLAGKVDASGAFTGVKTFDLDTSYTQVLAAFPRVGGGAGGLRVIMTAYASHGGGNGKPATVVATAIHLIDLADDGTVARDRRVLVPELQFDLIRAAQMPDGGLVIAGMGQPPGTSEARPLKVIRFDADGEVTWSKSFPSQAGTSRPDYLEGLADGSIFLAGSDFGNPTSHWVLRLHPDGGQAAYRVVVRPARFGGNYLARNTQGTFLHTLNADGASMLWAVDEAGTEKWRIAFAKGTSQTSLDGVRALPDGSFLVFGTVMTGQYGHTRETLLFRVAGDGRIQW